MNLILIISLLTIIIILLFIIIYFIMKNKNFTDNSSVTGNAEVNEQIDSNQNITQSNPQNDGNHEDNPIVSPENIDNFSKITFKTKETYTLAEILSSSGPRKNTDGNDTELGEDVGGIISLPECTYFWVLDGTSDSSIIKYPSDQQTIAYTENSIEEYHVFSSRLLAQSLSAFISKNIITYSEKYGSFIELLDAAKHHLSDELANRINDEKPEKKDKIIKQLQSGYVLTCSATVIIGVLLKNGKMDTIRLGDSKVFPFTKDENGLKLIKDYKFINEPIDENSRIIFKVEYNEASNNFTLKSNSLKCAKDEAEEVFTLLAFTDGIGKITQMQLKMDVPNIVDKVLENIAKVPQKTFDDKTLIVIKRLETI